MSSKRKIFVIDDDPVHRLLMSKLFEKQQQPYTIAFFENGKLALDAITEALAKGREELPDVILLDIGMPVMNGWEFLSAFKKIQSTLQKKILIYLVSSSFSEEDQEKKNSYPEIYAYLIKPIRMDTIQKIMNTVT